jgi:alanine-glyoxylate transaminase/serine-glyoxylate transaminase/serine-pyruvate transaminase
MGYWGKGAKRAYHHTAPVNTLYGLHESLVMLTEEGLENSWNRHQENHQLLRDGLQSFGIHYLVEELSRLPQLNSVIIPDNLNDEEVRNSLLTNYNIDIGAGLGALAGKIWRIGLMGYTSRKENIENLLSAMKETL